MTTPNMATIAALERSLQNCSLNRSSGHGGGVRRSEASDAPENLTNTESTLELNSHVSLPYEWEQCLDLETGEIYYINWQNGSKEKEDPRQQARFNEDYYSEEDNNSCDSEDSSSTSSSHPSPSSRDINHGEEGDHILVVAGCKSCLMYFMLPKRVEECPKCNDLLLHFDRLEDGSL